MIIGLRDRAAVTVVTLATTLICLYDARVGFGMRELEPSHQRRPEVEIQVRVVVDDTLDLALAIDDPCERVGAIAFGVDTLVPVMKRARAVLAIDRAGPRILARWLIEMTVNDYRGH